MVLTNMFIKEIARSLGLTFNLVTPKIAIFRRAGMREGGLPLPLAFQYLILMTKRACDLNLVRRSSYNKNQILKS